MAGLKSSSTFLGPADGVTELVCIGAGAGAKDGSGTGVEVA